MIFSIESPEFFFMIVIMSNLTISVIIQSVVLGSRWVLQSQWASCLLHFAIRCLVRWNWFSSFFIRFPLVLINFSSILQGFLVPKDWTVIYSIRETQQTSPIYTFPDRFNPDRWLEIDRQSQEFGADPARFHYIPFGYGARNCVGTTYAKLVMKVFLIELVESCSWTLKNRDIKMLHIPATVPADYLPATFTWRKSL